MGNRPARGRVVGGGVCSPLPCAYREPRLPPCTWLPWLVAVPPRDTLVPPIDPLDEEDEVPLTIGDDEPLDEEGEVPLTIGDDEPLDEEEEELPLTIGDDEPLDEEDLLLPTLLLLPPKESPLPPLGCPLEGA